jgi:hypothetical protein
MNDDLMPEQVPTLLGLPPSELLVRAGSNLSGGGQGLGPSDHDRFRRIALNWLEEHATDLRASICDNPSIQVLIDEASGDKLKEFSAVVDAFTALAGRLPAMYLCAFVVTNGLHRLCQ